MKPCYQDNHINVHNTDFGKNDLPDESVQMVCTSPPYWGLRKYSGEQELVWGDNHCEHEWDNPTTAIQGNNSMVRGKDEVDSGNFAIHKFKDTEMRQRKEVVGYTCSLCGAWKGAYGLEPTPEMYIEHTIEILREIRRVLRKDGVVFWNIGDSYAGSGGAHTLDHANPGISNSAKRNGVPKYNQDGGRGQTKSGYSLKPKDLCLIPFRLAIAAQGDGWVIRSVIIWSKPNPMPESVRDRPTVSHEYIIMMTKARQVGKLPLEISETDRHWLAGVIDGEGCIRVAKFHNSYGAQILVGGMHQEFIERVKGITGVGSIRKQEKDNGTAFYNWSASYLDAEAVIKSVYPLLIVKRPEAKVALSLKGRIDHAELFTLSGRIHQEFNVDISGIPEPTLDYPLRWIPEKYYWDADAVREKNTDPLRTNFVSGSRTHGKNKDRNDNDLGERSKDFIANGRNIRSVWEFPTQPYPEAHFAVFPEKLPEICIKAATPEVGCCSKCGAPWGRLLEKTGHINKREPAHVPNNTPDKTDSTGWSPVTMATNNWQPTCKCDADKVPSIVLDPFCGAGTTLWVAKKLNRQAIGYEISGEYCQLIVERNRQQALVL